MTETKKKKHKAKALAKAAVHAEGSLTANEERFCQIFATDREFFCNGTQSYMEAFDLEPKQYKTARTMAARLLAKVGIQQRISELVELDALNDATVDKELAKVIVQDHDFSSKVQGIREYNKLKQRITDRVDFRLSRETMTDAELDRIIEEQSKFFKKK